MQVNVTKVEGINASFEVQLPAEQFNTYVDKAFKKVAASVTIPGFRKGHAPRNVVLEAYGQRINSEAIDNALNSSIQEAVKKTELKVYPGSLNVTNITNNESGDFVYTCECEIHPTVEKKDLKDVNVELVNVTVSDADVDAMIERLRQQQSKWQVVDGAVVDQDSTANIDFLGKKDGVPFEGGKAEGFNLNIKNAQMIPGFTESIIGHKAGDSFTIECTFPEDYHAEELKGAKATFDITVNSVSKQVLPEIDADFLKAFGFEDKGLDALKSSLKSNLEQQAEIGSTNYNITALMKAIATKYPDFVAPRAMVNYMAEQQLARQFGGKLDDKLKNALLGGFAAQVEDQVNEQCLLDGLIAAENFKVQVEDAEVDAQIAKAAISYDDPEEFKTEVRKDKELLENVVRAAGNVKLMNFLAGLVNANTADKSFEEFQKLREQQENAIQERARERMMASIAKKSEQGAE